MTRHYSHFRIIPFPVKNSPAAGLLDTLRLILCKNRTDLLMTYHELCLSAQAPLFERNGRPWELVQGKYIQRCLHFTDARIVEGETLLTCLDGLAREDPRRLLNAVLAWCNKEGQNFYMIDLRRDENDTLLVTASQCLNEPIPNQEWATSFERDWSPPPLSPPRLIPDPKSLRRRFGGDPITVRLAGGFQHRRLFIGGLDTQTTTRPDVSAVLNLSEDASLWVGEHASEPEDRWENKGEGSQGMTVGDLLTEAEWVIVHLNQGERVLVHCSAGMNRSSTVCCAVLIRLEGLTAEAALERVREHHPWARPDPRHWLALRWLATR
jgi:hypothetical protein